MPPKLDSDLIIISGSGTKAAGKGNQRVAMTHSSDEQILVTKEMVFVQTTESRQDTAEKYQEIVENKSEKGSASTLMSMVPSSEEGGKKPSRKGRVGQACRNFVKMCRVRGG